MNPDLMLIVIPFFFIAAGWTISLQSLKVRILLAARHGGTSFIRVPFYNRMEIEAWIVTTGIKYRLVGPWLEVTG